MYYYRYDAAAGISVPEPFRRVMTPIFMADDPEIQGVGFSIHITEWEPGCEIDTHVHPSATEAMYCLSGRGIAVTEGETHPFVPGSMIVAPPGVSHKIVNTGSQTLRVFCVFSPPVTGQSLRERAYAAVAAANNSGDSAAEKGE